VTRKNKLNASPVQRVDQFNHFSTRMPERIPDTRVIQRPGDDFRAGFVMGQFIVLSLTTEIIFLVKASLRYDQIPALKVDLVETFR
jgi:hypothetical protein